MDTSAQFKHLNVHVCARVFQAGEAAVCDQNQRQTRHTVVT